MKINILYEVIRLNKFKEMITIFMKGKLKLKLIEILLILIITINMFTTAIRSTSKSSIIKMNNNSPLYLPKLRQFIPIPSSTSIPTG